MSLINKLSTGLLSTIFLLFQNQAVLAQLTQEEIKNVAQKITVQVVTISITSDRNVAAGSGVLVKKEGNLYYVLTNEHVVSSEDEPYWVRIRKESSIDESPVEQIKVKVNKKLSDVDLAVLTFEATSGQNYDLAEIADPNNLSKGQSAYVSGFPSYMNKNFKFVPTKITEEIRDGKQDFTYNPDSPMHLEKGMSGGSILNSGGKLLGIHKESGEDKICLNVCHGIPLKIIQENLKALQLTSAESQAATQPSVEAETNPPEAENQTATEPSVENETNPLEMENQTATEPSVEAETTPPEAENQTATEPSVEAETTPPEAENQTATEPSVENETKGYTGISLGGFFPDDSLDTGFGGSIFWGGKFTKNIGADLEFALLGGGTEFDDVDYTIWSLSINPRFFLPLTKKANTAYIFFSPGIGISQADVDGVRDIEDDVRFTWQTKLGLGLPFNQRYEGFVQIRYSSQTGENALDYFSSEVGISINF